MCGFTAVIAETRGAVVAPAFSVAEDFSRYQSIIDRKPFGMASTQESSQTNNPGVDSANLFTKTLKMVAIKLEKSGKTRIGFINQAAGNKSYYMRVGEVSVDGIEVVEADFKQESALLKKDSQTGWIYMNNRQSSMEGGKGMARGTATVPRAAASVKTVKNTSYHNSVQKINEDRTKFILWRSASKQKLSEEEMSEQLQISQMDIIRQGLPALPIPLTKEMDDQLVAEGVLPPLDATLSGQTEPSQR